jgi:hypothetical protein
MIVREKWEENGIREKTYECERCHEEILIIYSNGHTYPQVYPGGCPHYDWGYAKTVQEIPDNAITYMKGAMFYFYIFPQK